MFKTVRTQTQVVAAGTAALKKKAIAEATEEFNAGVSALVAGVPEAERESWAKQETEARSVLADPTSLAPYLAELAVSRGLGETKEELAQKVMASVSVYESAHAKLLGKYQSQVKSIEAEFQ